MKWWWTGLLLISAAVAEPKRDFARGVLENLRGNDGGPWFERAVEDAPQAWPLVRRVAERRFRVGDVAAASTYYREFVAARPDHLAGRIAYADFLRESSPDDDLAANLAIETLEEGLRRHPDHPALLRRLFRTYEQRGYRERSRELFERVAELPGRDHVLAAADMARTLFRADNEVARARIDEVFENAINRAPRDPVLARAASEHFRTGGRLPRAIEMLEIHTAADPNSLDLRVRLGILRIAAGQSEKGVATLEEVLAIDPDLALAHQTLAKYHRRGDRPAKARPHAVALLRIRGGDADAFVELAAELLADGQAREARLLLEKGLFDHPRDAAIATRLAIAARRDASSRKTAVRRFREAEALSGADGPVTAPEFQREFAEALIEAGRPEPAESRLRAAIKAYPSEASGEIAAALRRLATLWREEGRNLAAARALEARADRLAPRE